MNPHEQPLPSTDVELSTARRSPFVVGAVLLLAAAGVIVALLRPDARDAQPTRETTVQTVADLAALVGPWRPTPIAVPRPLWVAVETACREDWRRGDRLFERPHRGAEYVAALVDARGERRLTMAFRDGEGRIAFCTVMLTADAGVMSADIATFGGPGRRPPERHQVLVGPAWSDGSGDPGQPITKSGPVGLAGEGIHTAMIDSRGHPRVEVTVSNGVWAFWVPWDWEQFEPTISAYDAIGIQVARERLW